MESFVTKYALVVVIAAILVLLLKGDLFSSSPYIIIGQILAIALLLSARAAFRGSELRTSANPGSGQLIRKGPYRFIRHPMYAGALLLIVVSVAGHPSLLNAAIAVIVVCLAFYRISIEERLLLSRYPDYHSYAEETKKVIPFIY